VLKPKHVGSVVVSTTIHMTLNVIIRFNSLYAVFKGRVKRCTPCLLLEAAKPYRPKLII